MQIGARQCAAQLERRDGKIIAVHRCGQIHEACAAAVELPDGDGRDERDAGAGLDIEPQLIGNERAVLFAAFQCQLRFGLKEVEGVQLQAEGVFFLALEGIDLALNARQLQRHELGGVKTACGVHAVDLELIFLVQAIAQLFKRKFCAVEDGLEANLAAKHKITCRVGGGILQLHRGIGNVHIDDGIVLFGGDGKRKALVRERDFQLIRRAVLRLIELEGRGTEMYAALLDCSILFDDELSVRAPRGRDRGREQCRAAGKGKICAVFALIIAVNQGNGLPVLLF